MYTWFFCVFFYTRQAEADYYVYRCSSPSSPPSTSTALPPPSSASDLECLDMRPPPPPPLLGQPDESDHRFKIDLYIFIYVYIKKEQEGRGEGGREVQRTAVYSLNFINDPVRRVGGRR